MIKASLKLFLLILWIAVCYAMCWIAKACKKQQWKDKIAQTCYAGILRIVGIHIKTKGSLSDTRHLLVVSNHIS